MRNCYGGVLSEVINEKIMEAALKSPSWANTQPWEIYVAGGEVLNQLREAYVTNLKNCVARNFGRDSAVAVTLAAHPDLIRKELNIPDDLSIIIGIALGYADAGHSQNQYRTMRRSVQERDRMTQGLTKRGNYDA